MQNRFTQRGVTLIEMMIALVLSLVLVAGVGTVYLSSKRNYQSRDQLSLINETGRVALETLRNHLEHAGYSTPQKLPLPPSNDGNYFYVSGDELSAGSCGTLKTNSLNAIKSTATSDNDGNTGLDFGDTISIRFIGDATLFEDAIGSVLDSACYAGATSLESSLIYNGFRIATDTNTKDSLGNKVPIFYAAGSNANVSIQPIVNGVQNMQFLYGVDNDLDGKVDYFANATTVTANAVWTRVISIKVALLVRSIEPVLEVNTAQSYNLLDVTITANDRYLRRVYSTVIQLRNVVEN